MSIFSQIYGPAKSARITELEERVESLEQQMKKMDVVDEKVTRIWEQAKAFETFKARFDRSEASTSLRMDHLAMSLDELQKKTDDALARITEVEKRPPPRPVANSKPPAQKKVKKKLHTVVAGETLYSISHRYDITVDQLKSLNKLSGRRHYSCGTDACGALTPFLLLPINGLLFVMNDYFDRFRNAPVNFKKSFWSSGDGLGLPSAFPLFLFWGTASHRRMFRGEMNKMVVVSISLCFFMFLIKKWARALVVMGSCFVLVYDMMWFISVPPQQDIHHPFVSSSFYFPSSARISYLQKMFETISTG